MKNLFIIISLLFWGISCTKSEIPTYSGGDRIHFQREVKDSISMSFLFFPGVNNLELPIPLELTGRAFESDVKYKVVMDEKQSTAVKDVHFSLPENMIFKAGNYVDSCRIILNRTSDLKNKEVRLVLRIEETDQLKLGQLDRTVMVIRFSDKIARPDWWDNDMASYTMGSYSDKKYQLFIDVTGVADLSYMSRDLIRFYVIQFKYYLVAEKAAGRTVYEEPDPETGIREEMVVRIIG